MNGTPISTISPSYSALREAKTEPRQGWQLHTFASVDSTNTMAAQLPAWHAVRARTQNAGRGRTGRHWISDEGGLWLSAVLPGGAAQACWQFLPLAVGWSLARALKRMGVTGLRLRWPNDLMVGRRKLAGLLVERFTPDTVVVGVGINVFNTPEVHDAQLSGTTVRLSELVREIGSMEDLTTYVLSALRFGHGVLQSEGFAGIAADLNARWTEPRRVELTLAGKNHGALGRFGGIDADGALRLCTDDGIDAHFDATQVALLRELD